MSHFSLILKGGHDMSKKNKNNSDWYHPKKEERSAAHRCVRKRRIFKRKHGYTLWIYNGDGMFATERIKGKDKKYLQRWLYRRRKDIQRDIDEQYIDYLEEKYAYRR